MTVTDQGIRLGTSAFWDAYSRKRSNRRDQRFNSGEHHRSSAQTPTRKPAIIRISVAPVVSRWIKKGGHLFSDYCCAVLRKKQSEMADLATFVLNWEYLH